MQGGRRKYCPLVGAEHHPRGRARHHLQGVVHPQRLQQVGRPATPCGRADSAKPLGRRGAPQADQRPQIEATTSAWRPAASSRGRSMSRGKRTPRPSSPSGAPRRWRMTAGRSARLPRPSTSHPCRK
eukprot:2280528-Alexandrium_andersonii.AAC.2